MNLFHHVSIDTFYLPTLPAMGRVGFFLSHQSHPIPSAMQAMPAPQIPCQSHPKNMLYLSSIFLVSPPLSVGHPAPPFTPLVRPRTAVCSRGARARRERSGSGAPADRYSGGHRAAAAHAGTSAAHTAHAAGELAVSSRHPPPILHAARSAVACVTERVCLRNVAEGAAARSAVACVTERECLRNVAEGAAARSAVARVTECPPPGRAPARPALSDAGVSRPRGLSPRRDGRRGGFALMRIAPASDGTILRRDTPAE